eukprot:jgi/Mesvir1/3950/Mv22710-RA.1
MQQPRTGMPQTPAMTPQHFGKPPASPHTPYPASPSLQAFATPRSFPSPAMPAPAGVPATTPATPASASHRQRPRPRPAAGAATASRSMDAAPAARGSSNNRRNVKRKTTDKELPEKISAIIPESRIYTQLREFEKRIDSVLERKKLDIQEAFKKPPRVPRVLRLYILNTHSNQAGASSSSHDPAEPPSWTLRIVGHLLSDGSGAPAMDDPEARESEPKFSTFFRKIVVQLDPAQYPNGQDQVVWDTGRAGSSPVEADGVEICRRGSTPFTATVTLHMNYVPERFKLSPALSQLLGIEVETRARVIAALWQYVKANGLQDAADPTVINSDAHLARVFGHEAPALKFSSLATRLKPHLSIPDPIVLHYSIQLSGPSPSADACYDIAVDAPVMLHRDLAGWLASAENTAEESLFEDRICSAIRKINEHKRRRAFFLGFAQSPVDFINGLIASQARDLRVVRDLAGRDAEKERASSYYEQPWVEDAVVRYLHRRLASGIDAPGAGGAKGETTK